MAVAACVRCQSTSFELQEAKVAGARHKLMFVQCTGCGAPAGLVDGHAAATLQEQDQRLKELERQLEALAGSVTHIKHLVGSLANQRAI